MGKEILFDEQGLIYKIEVDGTRGHGDSCAESSRFYHLEYFRLLQTNNYQEMELKQHEVSEVLTRFFDSDSPAYVGIRAPRSKLPKEWPDPVKDFSSDQQTPWIMAMGAWGLDFNVLGVRGENQNHYNWNPMSKNIYARALGQTPSSLIDSSLWVTVLARCGKFPFWDQGLKKLSWGDPTNVADTLNLLHCFIQAHYAGQTWMSRKAWGYWRKNAIASHGTTRLGFLDRILGDIALYYEKDNQGLIEMYAEAIHTLEK